MKRSFLFFFSLLIVALVIAGCESETTTDNPISTQSQTEESLYSNGDYILSKCGGNSKLRRELSIARSSTTKYRKLDRAIADGYVDINVVVQNMGYHYLKNENVDGNFDPGKPEILVYAKNRWNGKMRLVAVEYAIPNTEPKPEGFTGNDDVWENNPDFGLWLCHAWVWYHNPDGIFTDMNPRVHVEEGEITYP